MNAIKNCRASVIKMGDFMKAIVLTLSLSAAADDGTSGICADTLR